MNEFNFRDDVLFCEDVPVTDIVKAYPTPFYLYSHKTIIDHFRKIQAAFAEIDPLVCFSMKSNSNLNIVRALVKEGSGMDIVSGGELYRAMKAGCPPEKIVYASVGKREEEIESAIKHRIFSFNVESVQELIMIDSVAKRLKKQPKVALRLNPDVRPGTHEYITTGSKDKKFGIDFKAAEDVFDNANKYSSVLLKGLHVHIGSQITETDPYVSAISKVLEFIDRSKIEIEWLNIGGGFGIDYGQEKARTADELARKIVPLVKDRSFRIILEPGRFIVGNSGILVTKVLYVKTGGTGKKFAIVDAGMNDLIRPSLYDAHHEILPVVKRKAETETYDVVGPICESGDFLGLGRNFPELVAGEFLAVMSAGAYGYVMSSNYNSRPRSAELMVLGGEVKVIKKAETYKDLIHGESIIKELK